MNVTDSTNDFLRPAEFAALLGVRPRRARQVLGELEALGFSFEPDMRGARLCPRPVAAAVRAAQKSQRELATLRLDTSLERFTRARRSRY